MLTDTERHTTKTLPGWVMSRIPMLAILAVASMGLTGCYTQLAVLEKPHGGLDQVVADYGDDGDILVRRYYEDGYVEEEVYSEYDWYTHRPYSYARYFDSFYGPAMGVRSHCWDLFYCDSFWGYTPSYSLAFGYGSWGVWGRPYASFGFGLSWGYDPFYYGVNHYRPYSHYPTWAWYGGGNHYNYGGVRAVTGHYAPRGETMARSALTSRTRGARGGRDLNGGVGVRGSNTRGEDLGTRTVATSGRAASATTSKGLATGTRPTRGALTGDRSSRNAFGTTRTSTRSSATGTRTTSRGVASTRSTTRTTRSAVGTRDYGTTTTRTRATSNSTGSRAVPSRTTSRNGSSVGRSANTRSRTSGIGRSTGSSSRGTSVGRSSGSSSRSSGNVRRSSGNSSRSSGVRSSSGSSSSRSSGRSSSRSGRKN
ncbi:MAG: hypothetical protein ACPGQT_10910 [Rhodothermales bacterium]